MDALVRIDRCELGCSAFSLWACIRRVVRSTKLSCTCCVHRFQAAASSAGVVLPWRPWPRRPFTCIGLVLFVLDALLLRRRLRSSARRPSLRSFAFIPTRCGWKAGVEADDCSVVLLPVTESVEPCWYTGRAATGEVGSSATRETIILLEDGLGRLKYKIEPFVPPPACLLLLSVCLCGKIHVCM